MTHPRVVSREEWRIARRDFLKKEKELTRARDVQNQQRRELPMVLMEKEYRFEGPDGVLSLLDLFEGRRQLILYHWMWPLPHEDWCRLCSYWIDNVGNLAHLNARGTTFVVDCPAPLQTSLPFKEHMGWNLPWVSSHGSDFFDDMHTPIDEDTPERPGVSVFLREGDAVYHTYSTYKRGADLLNGTYNFLDLTPLGRQEPTEGFKLGWVRYHDEYES
jgi:predicted dithiol-disulfide oxidoreductase (DUF899 family)